MREPVVQRRNREHIPHWGTYDAIVIGGGISGVVAARTMAAEGYRVVLIEPTGTLGREMTRAYNGFVNLSDYVNQSAALSEFYHCLIERKGVFGKQLDPTVAGIAFDDLLEPLPVDVRFHVWPSRLLTDEGKVTGLEVACRSGRARLDAPQVIDASAYGKIGKAWFAASPTEHGSAMIQLLYNGVTGECPDEAVLTLPRAGKLHVACRPTFWPNEWRLTLTMNHRQNRFDWQLLLDELLESLREHIPALQTGALAHLADDVWADPELRISTASSDKTIVGYLIDPHAELNRPDSPPLSVPIARGMLDNPEVVNGLFLAGSWLEGYPFEPRQEQKAIINAFLLGDLVGRTVLLSKSATTTDK